jgi:hypothetical protein
MEHNVMGTSLFECKDEGMKKSGLTFSQHLKKTKLLTGFP